ncbi:MAG TPA: hypothetical protein VIN34_10225 [Candidatus Limnocylindria bacterium]|jgi:hypothetical protein
MDLEATVMVEFEKKPFYSPREFARLVAVDPSTVMDWIHRELLFALQLGPKTYRIPLAVVMRRLNPELTTPSRVALDGRGLAADARRHRRRPVAATVE